MKRLEKFAFPLMIVAAVVAIWAFFRRGNSAPVIVQGSNGVNFPQLAPLQQTLYTSPHEPADYTSPTYTAAAGAGTSGAVYRAAVSDPSSGVLGYPSQAPAYLTYNIPPSRDLVKSTLAAGSAGDAAAGSGGSCGCSKSTPAPCNSKPAAPRLPDGAGTCIGSKIKAPAAVVSKARTNLQGYIDATGPQALMPSAPAQYVRSSEYGFD